MALEVVYLQKQVQVQVVSSKATSWQHQVPLLSNTSSILEVLKVL